MHLRFCKLALAACLAAIFFVAISSARAQQHSVQSSSGDESIPKAGLSQPAELVRMLHTAEKPLILQVGSHVLYAEAHIPGSEYAGPAGTDSGLEVLRNRLGGVSKGRLIVIYCGCCPWKKCPNIRPAFAELRSLGFTNVKALYLPENFGADWVNKGYSVESGR
jgi:thiosulfate/3-mercaptopyruvate sulfurtransferase